LVNGKVDLVREEGGAIPLTQVFSIASLVPGKVRKIQGGLHYLPRRGSKRGRCRPSCIDIFAGAGGLAEGFREAGFQILSGTDISKAAGQTFRWNFPEASFFELPIRELRANDLLQDAGLARGELDCLIGGPPCQAFSYNNHLRSDREGNALLFRDYLRLVVGLLPKCLVMENVPGILTIGNGAVVSEIGQRLQLLGYYCDVRILFAEDFGIPQERRRVFFVATRLDAADSLFPRGTHGPVRKPSEATNPFIHRWELRPGERKKRFPRVWSAIGDLPALSNGGGEDTGRHTRIPRSAYQQRMRGYDGRKKLFNHVSPKLSTGVLERISYVPEGGSWRDIPRKLLPSGMKRARESDHTKRYGRLEKRGFCCTILTKSDPHWGSYVHPERNRAISVREAARLQSFPDRFRFLGYRSDQFVQVGNAVPPLMAAALARRVRRHLRKHSG
jgi:DNA (cytosine-5)-methyltransferase 1